MRALKILITIIMFVTAAVLTGVRISTANENKNIDLSSQELNIKENSSLKVKLVKDGAMTASWYGPKFNGKATANTETFNQLAFTAAHKTLPFGTMLKLTNPKNGKSVIVRINDRGPYVKGRDIDLSKKAAVALGMVRNGVVKLNVEKIEIENTI